MNATIDFAQKRARALVGGLVWTVLAPIALTAIGKLVGPGGGPPPYLGLILFALCAVGWVGAAAIFRGATQRPAKVDVDGEGLSLTVGSEKRAIPFRAIESTVDVEGDGAKEHLDLRLVDGESLRVHFASASNKRAVSEAIAAKNKHAAARFRLSTPGSRMLLTASGGMLGMVLAGMISSVFAGALGALGPVFAILLAVVGMIAGGTIIGRTQPEVTIGSDGLAVKRGLAKPRFVPYAELESLSVARRTNTKNAPFWAIELTRRDAAPEVIGSLQANEAELATGLVRGMHKAMAERRGAPDAETAGAALDRRDGSIADWLGELRKLADLGEGYRNAALTEEQLVALLESPTASPQHRIGAAVVLRKREASADRIRVAAEAIANPKVRVALEAVADGDAEREELAVREALEEEADAVAKS